MLDAAATAECERDTAQIALANVSDTLVDSGVEVPSDPSKYGEAVRVLTAELRAELERLRAVICSREETDAVVIADVSTRAEAAEARVRELEAENEDLRKKHNAENTLRLALKNELKGLKAERDELETEVERLQKRPTSEEWDLLVDRDARHAGHVNRMQSMIDERERKLDAVRALDWENIEYRISVGIDAAVGHRDKEAADTLSKLLKSIRHVRAILDAEPSDDSTPPAGAMKEAQRRLAAIRDAMETFCSGADGFGCGTADPSGQSEGCSGCAMQPVRALVTAPFSEIPRCTWTEDDDGVFQTSCGGSWEFTHDGPGENRAKFCPYCGDEICIGASR